MCCGIFNRGDVVRKADDRKWWSDSFRFASGFWDTLGVYAKLDTDVDGEPSMHFDEDIARADPGALTQVIVRVQENDLPHFVTSKCEPPYIWPLVAGVPIPNAKCNVPDPTPFIPRLELPWWVWVVLGYFLLGEDNRKR